MSSGMGSRTSSLDRLFLRRQKWSPAKSRGSVSQLNTMQDCGTIKPNRYSEKPASCDNISKESHITLPPPKPSELAQS